MPLPLLAIIAAGQAIAGGIKAHNAKKESERLRGQREAYKTPKEVVEILNATQSNAQSGLDSTTLDFLTNQTDQAFAGSIGSAERLGADPNVLSGIFNQKVNAIMQIGAQNHSVNMANFNTYLNSLASVGANRAAEQKSQQELLRDDLQQVAIEKQVATQQMSEGLNTAASAYANYQTGQLFGETDLDKFTEAYGDQGESAYQYAKQNNLNFNQYRRKFNKLKTATN